MKFANYFKVHDCIKDAILYREGDIADKVYVVMQGEFEILKKI
jgi:CRP-like cAMP-binding protein